MSKDQNNDEYQYDDAPEEGDETTVEYVGIAYEGIASAIDTRIGFHMGVKSLLSEEDEGKISWHDGAITELNFLRQRLVEGSNYFLCDGNDEDSDGGNDNGDAVKPPPADVPLDSRPSEIPNGFRLPRRSK